MSWPKDLKWYKVIEFRKGMTLLDALVKLGFSKSQAKRLIKQGSVKLIKTSIMNA